MRLLVQIFSWVGVVMGLLAVIGGFTTTDELGRQMINGSAIVGGLLFFTQGALTLVYLSQER